MPTRRHFLQAGGTGLLSLPSFLDARLERQTFHVGVIADTHIIDAFYRGPEGSPLDTESIVMTTDRLVAARSALNALTPALDHVFVIGDYFHDYPSTDLEFYFTNTTRIDAAKVLTDGFTAPVHVAFGNHDYGVPAVSREMSHELFRRKLGAQPFGVVDHRGWKFIWLNNFLGHTWQVGHGAYDKGKGSLGETQLLWLEAQLAERRPTLVFVHYPLNRILPTEVADLGLHPLLQRHAGTIQRVVSGHLHRWIDFGTVWGPPHLVMGATRYDPDAYLVVEIDAGAGTHRLLNLDLVEWNSHYSEPFRSPPR